MRYRYGTIDTEFAASLATFPPERDGPALMVNFMRYHAVAQYSDGTADVSGKEADDRYAPTEILSDIGATVAFFGDVTASGEDDRWDRIGIVRYPTRRAFIEMQARGDFRDKHEHKAAGMEFTIVVVAVPSRPVGEAPVGTGPVRFILWPHGAEPTAIDGAAVLRVEGRVIGDERTFDVLTIDSASDTLPDLPAGAVWAVAERSIDRLGSILGTWPD